MRLCLISVGVGRQNEGTRKQGHGGERARVRAGKAVGARWGGGERMHLKEGRELAGRRGGGREGEGVRESKEGLMLEECKGDAWNAPKGT